MNIVESTKQKKNENNIEKNMLTEHSYLKKMRILMIILVKRWIRKIFWKKKIIVIQPKKMEGNIDEKMNTEDFFEEKNNNNATKNIPKGKSILHNFFPEKTKFI